MSTRGSILYHRDEDRNIEIHIYEELIGDYPQDIRAGGPIMGGGSPDHGCPVHDALFAA